LGLVAGEALNRLGVCPIVKRIWTPSWTLFSTGWALLFLAAFYAVIEIGKISFWAWPAIIVGMNSIAIYVVDHLTDGWILQTIKTHTNYYVTKFVGGQTLPSGEAPNIFTLLDFYWTEGKELVYARMCSMIVLVVVLWLMCFWMYRRKLFIRL
jgi:predicted acyltransferase